MKDKALTFNPDHKVLILPGGGGGECFKPKHRLFLCCSHLPTQHAMKETAQFFERLKKLEFPLSFVPVEER